MLPDSTHQLILASSSKYRKELLSRLGFPFTAISPDIDETPLPEEKPQETAARLAFLKAKAIGFQHPGSIVIGSDQVAECQGEQIGKPGSFEKALIQLQKMRGKEVYFHTALCVWNGMDSDPDKTTQQTIVKTVVTFRNLPDEELAAYLRIEKPYDCAGSARNEALGIAILEKIESSDPTALTGLPLIALTGMLRQCDLSFFSGATK